MFFFFSSRRRHTRCSRDWSSDVCSSDLPFRLQGTVMSNLWLDRALQSEGIRLLRAPVGDKYVLEEMQKGGYVLGGEPSGHIIFLENATTGDGLLTGLLVLDLVRRTGLDLAAWAATIRP